MSLTILNNNTIIPSGGTKRNVTVTVEIATAINAAIPLSYRR
ncbi:MAG: hypothetical protein ACFB14_12210 [Leptolyngbyaceae cyanobacterium]